MKKHLQIMGLLTLGLLLGGQVANLALAADVIPDPTPAVSDTTFPADVTNLKAVAGNGQVTLNWDMATDNVGVKGYNIFYGNSSVSSGGGSYNKGPIDAGNVLTYVVKGLDNDKTYYFAITAYDAAGNESEFYSTEASATPKAGVVAIDLIAPKVVSAGATDKNGVSVKFSEAIKLPADKAQTAFSIKEDVTNTILEVSKAEIDATDKTGQTVLLTTGAQQKGSKYVLTAGIQLQDLAGNPIVSGTSDTAVFTGTDAAKLVLKPAADTTQPPADASKPAADVNPPAFTSVKAIDANTVEVTFSEPVVLLTNAAENFIITSAADNTKITNVKKVSIAQNGQKVTLTTDDLSGQKYNLVAMMVKDAAGNLMQVENSATIFDGVAAVAPVDSSQTDSGKNLIEQNLKQTLPVGEAASDLLAKAMANLMVNLSWKSNPAKLMDVANFVVYMSTDKGMTYGDGVVLKNTSTSYNFKNLQADMVYYFKLTTKDKNGVESDGLVTTFTLPGTGPEIGFLFFGSAGMSAWLTRKKKK